MTRAVSVPGATGKALVIGDDTRSFLATVRSLGRQGVTVDAAPENFRSPSLASRYIRRSHPLPYYFGDGMAWQAAMLALLEAERYDLVIPCNERSLLPIDRHREVLARVAGLALPDPAAMAVMFDKGATRELAERLGIPVAKGCLTQPDGDTRRLIERLDLPLVLKRRRSYSMEDLYQRANVVVVRDSQALDRVIRSEPHGEWLAEAFFAGTGLGMSVLASKGKLLQVFEHHRVHELLGESYYRVSASPTPELRAACSAFVSALGYTGLAMFEFKRDPTTGSWVLLEVNARPWGSMPLPVALGVDFPYRLYRLLVHGEETPEQPYPVGVYGRTFVPDVMQVFWQARLSSSRPAAFATWGKTCLASCAATMSGREHHDVLARDDVRPGTIEIGRLVARGARRLARPILQRLQPRAKSDRAVVRRLVRNLGGRSAAIVFVCEGNICRGPFAARILAKHLPALRVSSAGLLPYRGRSSPPNAISAAAEFGVALTEHRSRFLDSTVLDGADLIIIFDEVNAESLADHYPDLAIPVVRLGSFGQGPASTGPIEDPIGGDVARFRACYGKITAAIEGLVVVLGDRRNNQAEARITAPAARPDQ
jgi:protein-tyrosine-phosphatase/predicted ATP-grasp superfamily ATP-dependent carboligase